MSHDPSDPTWLGRDRFVLSCGHSSLTQYIQLFLSGYGLELKDLKALRTWGSLTPGHPEVHHTAGVEITTGPLGSGLASAVGMAMAQRRQRGLLDPDAKPGESVVRPPRVGARLRRRPDGRRCVRSLLARRPPGARQPHRRLRREPDLDRGRHRHLVQRGRRQALRGLRLGRRRHRLAPLEQPGRHPRLHRGRRHPPRGPGEEQEVAHQADPRAPAHRHRLAGPDGPRHRQVARLGARRRRDRRHQEAARLRPGARPSRSTRTCSPAPAR